MNRNILLVLTLNNTNFQKEKNKKRKKFNILFLDNYKKKGLLTLGSSAKSVEKES